MLRMIEGSRAFEKLVLMLMLGLIRHDAVLAVAMNDFLQPCFRAVRAPLARMAQGGLGSNRLFLVHWFCQQCA